ncbi:hypothetical protein B0H67DRAFT_493847 [Lasiosphaeris hirsuta]|uniref:FYVE-type domain-containing protein n=1 Tax=Lasiosphaeris hirsuta TaxID=260670 RepID=A0AA40A8R4_9PEZI|nr:hypothetical protein B0H67DRAFT_493847 [Lasiosphaeris hirsuta]
MATDFIMPRLPDQQQFFTQQQSAQIHQLQQQPTFPQAPIPTPYAPPAASAQYTTTTTTQQISPLSTSGNASPTSPKNYLGRPIRPLYMPAVLRPTQFPSKAPPPRPKGEGEDESEERTLRPNSSFISLGGLSALGRLSRRSTGDSGKCVDGKWNLDRFPKPTGTPTRRHWKADEESAVCDHATCKRYFSYFTRRHHCRKCGNIFCDTHSNFEIPLDQDANYNPRGINSRACAHCYSQFKEWRTRTNSQSSSLTSSDGALADTPTSPIVASPASVASHRLPNAPDVALSVPRDWNWSTF